MRTWLIPTLLAATVLMACGCNGTPQNPDSWKKAAKFKLDFTNGVGTLAYGLIQAQAASGTEPIIPQATLTAVGVSNAAMAKAYAAGMLAIAEGNEGAADVAIAQVGMHAAEIGVVKAQYCPVINKDD